MKVVILAGGFGTRLSEATHSIPKPMVPIGEKPILWHIMKLYSHYGYNEFVICLGYKGYIIKEWFSNYFLHNSDVTIDLQNNQMEIHNNLAEPWKVSLVETGLHTMTGGRIRKVKDFLNNEPFLLTYGDGVSNVNIKKLVDFHEKSDKKISVTAYKPEGRFGALKINNNDAVEGFLEKPDGDGNWINAGFFVCEPEVIDFIEDDNTIFEKEPLEKLASSNFMQAYKHDGFWKPMDTLRDNTKLNELWGTEKAPWKVW